MLRLSRAGGLLHTGTSCPPVPACHAKLTNQCTHKQHVVIFTTIGGMLYGCKAEVGFRDYFLERRVTDVQSALCSSQYKQGARAQIGHINGHTVTQTALSVLVL